MGSVTHRHLPYRSFRSHVLVVAVASVVALLGCGGNGTPPPAQDFSLSLSPSSLALQQLGDGAELTISITPANGFSGSVTITFPNLPAGIVVAPVGFSQGPPYVASPGQPLTLGVSAVQAAAVGNGSITVQGTSGSISHTTTIGISVSAAVVFQLNVSPSTVTIGPNGVANAQVTLTPGANFGSSSVYLTTPSLHIDDTGVDISISSQFLTAAQPQSTISFQASFEVHTGNNIPVPLTGSLGAQSVNVPLTLNITNPAPQCNNLSRSTVRRTDMDATGVVYDPVHKLVFAAVQQTNTVEVYSSVTEQTVATIPVAAPRQLDISPDGSRVLVGSLTRFLSWVNPVTLQVVGQVPVVSDLFNGPFPPTPLRPVILASGKVLAVMGDGPPYEWDPATNVWRNPTPTGFVAGTAVRRSADHTKVVVAGGSMLAIFDSASDSYGPVQNIATSAGALNSDGSRLALIEASPTIPGGNQVVLLDNQFNVIATYQFNAENPAGDVIFSRDDSLVYVVASGVVALRSTDLSFAGAVPYSFIGAVEYPPDTDETGMIFFPGIMARSAIFTDASAPCALGVNQPVNMFLTPHQGTVTSPSPTTVSAVQGITSGSQVYFGAAPGSPQATPGTNLLPSPPTAVQVTPPNAQAPGAVNVTVTNPDGSVGIVPDGFSYGSNILAVATNSGPVTGGTPVTIYGYGFAFDQSQIQVTVGGKAATTTNVAPSSGTLSFPFPMDQMTFTTPAGAPGPADIVVTTPVGSATVAGGFHYLQNVLAFPVSSTLSEVVYDQSRQRLYAADYNTNLVYVFDLSGQQYLTPIVVGNSPQALALTPDFTTLVVSNGADGSISIVDLTGVAATKTVSLSSLSSLPPYCSPVVPWGIATTSKNQAVIALQCPSLGAGEYIVLDLATQAIGCGTSQACAAMIAAYPPNLAGVLTISGTTDGSKILLWNGITTGLWDVNSDTFISQPFGDDMLGYAEVQTAAAADGTAFAQLFGVNDRALYLSSIMQDPDYLQTGINDLNSLFGEKLHPSGALLYFPQTDGIDIYDVNHGHIQRRIVLPLQVSAPFDAMALDQTGSQIFLISTTGLTIVSIADLPLSLGSVLPSQGPASGGTSVRLRGSGFQSGAQVLFGAVSAVVSFVDSSTLEVTAPSLPVGPVRITIVNSDGGQYSLDNAFTAN